MSISPRPSRIMPGAKAFAHSTRNSAPWDSESIDRTNPASAGLFFNEKYPHRLRRANLCRWSYFVLPRSGPTLPAAAPARRAPTGFS